MKKQLNYKNIFTETLILTGAIAIISAAVYFSWYQVTLLSAASPALESYSQTSYHCHCPRSR